MIPTSDLRKGNLIKTEYGILPVHAISFNDVQVKGKDGRILWAKEIEGVELNEEILQNLSFKKLLPNIEELSQDEINAGKLRTVVIFQLGNFTFNTSNGWWIWNKHLAIKPSFAHELQNMFYWIERKELIYA